MAETAVVDGGVGGHDHRRRVRLELAGLLQHLQPVHARHLEVHQQHVPLLRLEPLHRRAAVGAEDTE